MHMATHLYFNGNILTMDSRGSCVKAMAVKGDTILGVGSEEELSVFIGPETKRIDLAGKTMLPGFYDGHSHFMRAGQNGVFFLNLNAFPIGPLRTVDDVLNKIKEHAATVKPGEWIIGSGYDETALAEQRHLTLKELDAVCPENPLFIRHISGHLALANSLAFQRCGIDENTPNPAGGVFVKGDNGLLTGLIEEPAAMEILLNQAIVMTPEKWLQSVAFASDMYVAKGVTTAHDGGVTQSMWESYLEADRRGLIKNRVQLLPRYALGGFRFEDVTNPASGTPITPSGRLTLGAVKLFQDGSLQGYTGYLTNPYYKLIYEGQDPMWRGYPIRSREELIDTVVDFHKKGWQIAIHGNGDNGIDDILCAFEEAQKAFPRHDARHVIIHCQTVREDQLDRMKRLGVLASFFVVHTYYWGDRHEQIFLGPERAARIDPLRSALKRGITFTNHNDTFVTPIDPLMSVWSAVNRQTSSGKVLGPDQTIPVMDALRSITIWGAIQHCEEKTKGSLEPGKLADMVVLGANPLTIDPLAIRDIPIVATIVGNEIVYGAL